jgi:cytochrome b561
LLRDIVASAILLAALVVLHVAAALPLVWRDRSLARMWWKRPAAG